MESMNMSTLMQEIELQKKRMNLAALSSLQEYLKQLISLSMLQQNITRSTKVLIKPSVSTSSLADIDNNSQTEKTAPHSPLSKDIQVKCEEMKPDTDCIKIEEEVSGRKSDSESPSSIEIEESPSKSTEAQPLFNLFPRQKKELACEHTWRKHHAKGLCKRCYEKHGRTKKAWNCSHEVHFARGLCRKCYFKSFKKQANYDPQIYNELKAKLFAVKKRQ